MQQLSRRVARNSAFGLAAQVTIRLLSFGFSVLVVRQLGAETYGQYAAVLAFAAVFVVLADLGLSPYAVREVARWRDAPDGIARSSVLFGNLLRLRLLLSLVASALLIGTAWATGRPPVMVGAIALGAIGLVIYSVQGASDAMLAGFERLDLSAVAKMLNQAAFVAAGAAALWLGTGYYGLIVANLLGVTLMTLLCWRGVRQLGVQPGRVTPPVWPAMLRASLPFGVIGLTLGLSYRFDSVLLNVFRGDAETGYYNAAYNLVFSAVTLSNVLNTALYPSLARHAVSAPDTLPRVYDRALRYLLALAFPIAIGSWALAAQLVPFLFSDRYLPAVTALQVLIWTVPLMFASEFFGYVLVVQGMERRVARAIVASTTVNVALNLVLVPRFGLLAAAVMTVVTEAVLVGQYVWVLRGLVRQIDWSRTFLRPLLAALSMGGLLLLLPDLPLPLKVGLGGLAYGGLLLALGVLGRDELQVLRSFRHPVPDLQPPRVGSARPEPVDGHDWARGVRWQ